MLAQIVFNEIVYMLSEIHHAVNYFKCMYDDAIHFMQQQSVDGKQNGGRVLFDSCVHFDYTALGVRWCMFGLFIYLSVCLSACRSVRVAIVE